MKTSTNFVSLTPSLRSTARLVMAYLKSSSGYCTCVSWDLVTERNRRPKSPSPARQSFDNRWATSSDDFEAECYALVRRVNKIFLVVPQGRELGRRAWLLNGLVRKLKRGVSAPTVDRASRLQLSLEEYLCDRERTKRVSVLNIWMNYRIDEWDQGRFMRRCLKANTAGD